MPVRGSAIRFPSPMGRSGEPAGGTRASGDRHAPPATRPTAAPAAWLAGAVAQHVRYGVDRLLYISWRPDTDAEPIGHAVTAKMAHENAALS